MCGFSLRFACRLLATGAPPKQIVHGVVESHEVRLGSKLGGRVKQILIKEGQTAAARTPLLELDAPELEQQRKQVVAKIASAEAALQRALAGPRPEEIAAAQAAYAAATARAKRSNKGWREEEIRIAQADLEAAQAAEKFAKAEFDRVLPLFRARTVSQADLDLAQSNLAKTLGATLAAKARVEMFNAGTRPEDKEEASADERRFKANLDLLQAGSRSEDIEQAKQLVVELKAKLAEIDVNLAETKILAPNDCLVETIAVRTGDILQPNQPAILVLGKEDIWVRIYVQETQLAQYSVGDDVIVSLDNSTERFKGKIIQINTLSEFTPRNVQTLEGRKSQYFGVKVAVDTELSKLKPAWRLMWKKRARAHLLPRRID